MDVAVEGAFYQCGQFACVGYIEIFFLHVFLPVLICSYVFAYPLQTIIFFYTKSLEIIAIFKEQLYEI
jgi:hypothetical protein